MNQWKKTTDKRIKALCEKYEFKFIEKYGIVGIEVILLNDFNYFIYNIESLIRHKDADIKIYSIEDWFKYDSIQNDLDSEVDNSVNNHLELLKIKQEKDMLLSLLPKVKQETKITVRSKI